MTALYIWQSDNEGVYPYSLYFFIAMSIRLVPGISIIFPWGGGQGKRGDKRFAVSHTIKNSFYSLALFNQLLYQVMLFKQPHQKNIPSFV